MEKLTTPLIALGVVFNNNVVDRTRLSGIQLQQISKWLIFLFRLGGEDVTRNMTGSDFAQGKVADVRYSDGTKLLSMRAMPPARHAA